MSSPIDTIKRFLREIYSRPMLCDQKNGLQNDVEPLECTIEELKALDVHERACTAEGADMYEPGQFGFYKPHFMGIPIKWITPENQEKRDGQ